MVMDGYTRRCATDEPKDARFSCSPSMVAMAEAILQTMRSQRELGFKR